MCVRRHSNYECILLKLHRRLDSETDNSMSRAISVLIIDDDEQVLEASRRSLKLFGFQSYLAKDGPTGLKLAQAKKPPLLSHL